MLNRSKVYEIVKTIEELESDLAVVKTECLKNAIEIKLEELESQLIYEVNTVIQGYELSYIVEVDRKCLCHVSSIYVRKYFRTKRISVGQEVRIKDEYDSVWSKSVKIASICVNKTFDLESPVTVTYVDKNDFRERKGIVEFSKLVE